MNKKITLSARRKISLTDNDIKSIDNMIAANPDRWKAEVKLNTKIDSRTIDSARVRGWMEFRSYKKLKDYLKALPQQTA